MLLNERLVTRTIAIAICRAKDRRSTVEYSYVTSSPSDPVVRPHPVKLAVLG